MSEEIEEGCRVLYLNYPHLVLAQYGKERWIRRDGSLEPFTVHVSSLTLIPPEPMTLRPKYEVGERVWYNGKPAGTIKEIVICYRTRNGALWEEADLAAHCPTCGGSGVASE